MGVEILRGDMVPFRHGVILGEPLLALLQGSRAGLEAVAESADLVIALLDPDLGLLEHLHDLAERCVDRGHLLHGFLHLAEC